MKLALILSTIGFGQAYAQQAAPSVGQAPTLVQAPSVGQARLTKQLKKFALGGSVKPTRRLGYDEDSDDSDETEPEEGYDVEGDMILDWEQIMEMRMDLPIMNMMSNTLGDAMMAEDAVSDVHHKWPIRAGVVEIPYLFVNQLSTRSRNNFDKAILELAQETCVRFVPWTRETDYVRVEYGRKCSSHVGRRSRNRLNIGDRCRYGTYLHEMLHTVGMYHEQSRPDRDQYININLANIDYRYRGNFLKCKNCHTMGVPYEYGSVMHYGAHAFARDRSRNTITTKTGAVIGQRTHMTELDAVSVNKLYGCNSRPVGACASREGDMCKCRGTVYFGRKYAYGQPGSGSLTTLDQMTRTAGAYASKEVKGSVQCNNVGMGRDPAPGYYKYCLCKAKTFTLNIRGDKGDELVRFSVGGIVKTVQLTTNIKWYTFKQPTDGKFSITTLNDNGPRNARVQIGVPYDVDFYQFSRWRCGTSREQPGCQLVRDGSLNWNGEYKYNLL